MTQENSVNVKKLAAEYMRKVTEQQEQEQPTRKSKAQITTSNVASANEFPTLLITNPHLYKTTHFEIDPVPQNAGYDNNHYPHEEREQANYSEYLEALKKAIETQNSEQFLKLFNDHENSHKLSVSDAACLAVFADLNDQPKALNAILKQDGEKEKEILTCEFYVKHNNILKTTSYNDLPETIHSADFRKEKIEIAWPIPGDKTLRAIKSMNMSSLDSYKESHQLYQILNEGIKNHSAPACLYALDKLKENNLQLPLEQAARAAAFAMQEKLPDKVLRRIIEEQGYRDNKYAAFFNTKISTLQGDMELKDFYSDEAQYVHKRYLADKMEGKSSKYLKYEKQLKKFNEAKLVNLANVDLLKQAAKYGTPQEFENIYNKMPGEEKGKIKDIYFKSTKSNLLSYLIQTGDSEKAKMLLQQKVGRQLLFQENENGTTPLHFAAVYSPDMIPELLKQDDISSIVNSKTILGNTPLMKLLARPFDPEMVEALIEKGADVNIANDYGSKPLLRLQNRHPEAIATFKLLLKKGADPTIETTVGQPISAWSGAMEKRQWLLVEAMLASGKISEKHITPDMMLAVQKADHIAPELQTKILAAMLKKVMPEKDKTDVGFVKLAADMIKIQKEKMLNNTEPEVKIESTLQKDSTGRLQRKTSASR